MRDKEGNTLPNAHLTCVYSRLCKLLYFKVKPVFVFDGKVPLLKTKTCTKRRAVKKGAFEKAEKLGKDKTKARLKQFALAEVMGIAPPATSKSKNAVPRHGLDAMFVLEDNEDVEKPFRLISHPVKTYVDPYKDYQMFDPSRIDPFSDEFKSLPAEIQHEQVLELIEHNRQLLRTKQCHENKDYSNFSDYQIQNVVTKNKLSKRLREIREQLNNTETTQDCKYKVHSLKVASDPNTEIVFTKLINDHHFNMLDQNEDSAAVKLPDEKPQIIKLDNSKSEIISSVKDELSLNAMRSLFFGSGELSDKSDDSGKEDDQSKVERTVLGASHPGMFINPYTTHINVNKPANQIPEVNTKNLFTELGNTSVNLISDDDSDEEPLINVSPVKDTPMTTEMIEHVDNTSVSKICEGKAVTSVTPVKEHTQTTTKIVEKVKIKDSFINGVNTVGKKADSEIIHVDVKSNDKEHEFRVVTQARLSEASHGPVAIEQGVLLTDKQDLAVQSNANVTHKHAPLEPISSADASSSNDQDVNTPHTLDDSTILDFIQTVKGSSTLQELSKGLNDEIEQITEDQRGQKAIAARVSNSVVSEVKYLLKVFGIPFIDAPGEAEAQCAELCRLKLCDGVITDDSDIFLFGDVVVYRNVFRTGKEMEQYSSRRINETMGLDRSRLIELAHLLGSDYCDGVTGVGRVKAMELLSEFETLENFVTWKSTEMKEPQLKGFKNTLIPVGFPSEEVTNAYLQPSVNSSSEQFSWAKPDDALIKEYLCKKLNWPTSKIDETLQPVLRRLESAPSTQPFITKFFHSDNIVLKPSARVTAAAKKLKSSPKKAAYKKAVKSEPKSRKRKLSKKAAAPVAKKFQGLSSEESN